MSERLEFVMNSLLGKWKHLTPAKILLAVVQLAIIKIQPQIALPPV